MRSHAAQAASPPARRRPVPGWMVVLVSAAAGSLLFVTRSGMMSGAPVAPQPSQPSGSAIIVCAGGQLPEGPTAHVLLRLEKAAEMWRAAPEDSKPFVITTAWGTVHKPCPHDVAGFEVHEAEMNAKWLLKHGVPAQYILEEHVSLETIGNAYFARLIHCEPLGLRRITVVNNRWHMPRTRAVFEHVFGISAVHGTHSGYTVAFEEVGDGLPSDVLESRLAKESAALPKFVEGGPWRQETPTLSALHRWVFRENTAYAAKRLSQERKPLDPQLAKSY